MMGVASISWVITVVGNHAIHSGIYILGPLTGTILGQHSSCRGTRLIIACVRAVVIHLAQFRLPWAIPSTMDHPLVVTPVSLVLMVKRGINLLS